jgi:peptidoglycan/LPS O-acetylase OafA/YrhL
LTRVQNEPLLRPIMPELDSIRGLAILMVVVYHGFYWQNDLHGLSSLTRLFVLATWMGRMGVNLFFVLSGFLITGVLLGSVERPDYYRRFYVRRALRILPAYYGLLFILAFLAFIHRSSFAFIGLSAVYVANMAPLLGVPISYPVLWSLAVEEHFYLVWPMVVRRLAARRLLLCALAIVLITPILRWISFAIDSLRGYVSFTFNNYTWNSADGLAFGALLVIALREFRWSRRTLGRFSALAILGAAGIWLAGMPFGILSRQATAVGAALQVVPWNLGFAGLLGLFLLVGTTQWKAVVLSPWLRFLGKISYGLYLIHLLSFDAYDRVALGFFPHLESLVGRFPELCIRFICSSCVAVVVAYFSRVYFEQPFLGLKGRLDSRRTTIPLSSTAPLSKAN